jgi:hypothetical protein
MGEARKVESSKQISQTQEAKQLSVMELAFEAAKKEATGKTQKSRNGQDKGRRD